MRKTFIVSLMVLLGLSQIGAVEAANSNLFSNGLQLYQSGQYQSALNAFVQVEREDQHDLAVHYMIAITMVKMNHLDAAANEYKWIINFDPNGVYGQQARIGLQSLTAPSAAGFAPAGGFASSSGNPAMVAGAMNSIRQQAHIAKQVKRSDVQANINDIRETADGHASNLAKRRDAIADDMASAALVTSQGDVVAMYDAGDIAAMEQRFNNKIADVQAQGAADAQQAQIKGNQAVNALRDSVHNLYSQLQDPRTSGVHLIPQGTNLYVRNYSD